MYKRQHEDHGVGVYKGIKQEEYVQEIRLGVGAVSYTHLANDKNVVDVVKDANCRIVYYSADNTNAYTIPDWYLEKTSKPLPTFIRFKDNPSNLEIIPYERKIIGEFNEENFLAGAVMANELGVRKEFIQSTISKFKGIKRRLEIKVQNNNFLIIDDFGSSPPKAKGSLKAVSYTHLDVYKRQISCWYCLLP